MSNFLSISATKIVNTDQIVSIIHDVATLKTEVAYSTGIVDSYNDPQKKIYERIKQILNIIQSI
jgi:hypothetical protein